MPKIMPSSDLINKYNEISKFCHKYSEPVYITKNGHGDLAVMSIETYEKLIGTMELHGLLNEGMNAMKNRQLSSAEDVFEKIESNLIKSDSNRRIACDTGDTKADS